VKSANATRTDVGVSNVSGDSTQGQGYAEIGSPYDDITQQTRYAEYEDINEPLAVSGYERLEQPAGPAAHQPQTATGYDRLDAGQTADRDNSAEHVEMIEFDADNSRQNPVSQQLSAHHHSHHFLISAASTDKSVTVQDSQF